VGGHNNLAAKVGYPVEQGEQDHGYNLKIPFVMEILN
jgi:hypothetical protein